MNIEPYWCELYFNVGENLDDPFCDDHPKKNEKDRVCFLRFLYDEGSKAHRNRMEICLGDKDNQVPVLLKRA